MTKQQQLNTAIESQDWEEVEKLARELASMQIVEPNPEALKRGQESGNQYVYGMN